MELLIAGATWLSSFEKTASPEMLDIHFVDPLKALGRFWAQENARPIHGGAQLRVFLRLLAAISCEQLRHCKASICREPCQGPLTAWVAHGGNSYGCSSLHVMKDLNSTQLQSPCQVPFHTEGETDSLQSVACEGQ